MLLKQRILWRSLVLLGVILWLTAPSLAGLESTGWPVSSHWPRDVVTRIIDGDTIEVARLGKIRYIGVNTPELSHPKRGMEPLAAEACEINKRLVLGKTVALECDVQLRDRYGRRLAYIYVGTVFINAYLVETGYAQVITVPPNVKYTDLSLKLQRKAVQNRTGLWSENPPLLPKSGAFVSSIKSYILPKPDCPWAQAIIPSHRIWFKTMDDATNAGYRPCKVCNP